MGSSSFIHHYFTIICAFSRFLTSAPFGRGGCLFPFLLAASVCATDVRDVLLKSDIEVLCLSELSQHVGGRRDRRRRIMEPHNLRDGHERRTYHGRQGRYAHRRGDAEAHREFW